jgi:Flp pilus assembly pilin Flp
MENRARIVRDCCGQSVAEYAVVLALLVIVAITVILGIGQNSRARLANVNTILDGHSGGASTGAAGAGVGTSGNNSQSSQGSGNASGSNQGHTAAAGTH